MVKKSAVVGFMFDQGHEEVLLINKVKPAWMAGTLNGPGGSIEANELPIDAMVREWKEETDIDTKAEDWREFAVIMHPKIDIYFFRAIVPWKVMSGAKAMPQFDETGRKKHDDELLQLVNVREFIANLAPGALPNLRWLIPMALGMEREIPTKVKRFEISMEEMQ